MVFQMPPAVFLLGILIFGLALALARDFRIKKLAIGGISVYLLVGISGAFG